MCTLTNRTDQKLPQLCAASLDYSSRPPRQQRRCPSAALKSSLARLHFLVGTYYERLPRCIRAHTVPALYWVRKSSSRCYQPRGLIIICFLSFVSLSRNIRFSNSRTFEYLIIFFFIASSDCLTVVEHACRRYLHICMALLGTLARAKFLQSVKNSRTEHLSRSVQTVRTRGTRM